MDAKEELELMERTLRYASAWMTPNQVRLTKMNRERLSSSLFSAARDAFVAGDEDVGWACFRALIQKLHEGFPKGSCVIYCRVSTESQMKGHGLWRQLDACRRYAETNDLSIVGVFSEVGSGVDPLPVRATAQRMAEAHGCVLLCEDHSRWSRKGIADMPPEYVLMTSDAERELEAAIRAAFTPAQQQVLAAGFDRMREQAEETVN